MEPADKKQLEAFWADEEKIPTGKAPKLQESAVLVNHPAHYHCGDIECIDAIKAATPGLTGYEGFLVGNAIKYLWRWKHKGGVTDLEKSRWYIDRLISELGDKNAN